jgi:signal transduction histidine kinase
VAAAVAAAEARCEAVLAERAALARELCDTLLQRFTGLTLQVDGVRNALERQSSPAAHELSRILQQADRTLREARDLVRDTRARAGIDIRPGRAMGEGHRPGGSRTP